MTDIFTPQSHFSEHDDSKSVCIMRPSHAISPRISVLMPVHENAPYFCEALQSALNQDCDFPYEIIVVDNTPLGLGATRIQELIQSLASEKISYYRNERNIGMIGNWNRCVELANSDCVTFCHSDDVLFPSCLRELNRLHEKNGEKCIVTAFNTIDGDGKTVRKASADKKVFRLFPVSRVHGYSRFDIFMQSPGYCTGSLFSKDCLMDIGGFSEEYYPSSDYALFIQYLFKFGMVYSENPLFAYRKAVNESKSAYKMFAERDLFFRECMVSLFPFPKKILRGIMSSNYRKSKVDFAAAWAGQDKEIGGGVSFSDRLVLKLSEIRKLKWCRKQPLIFP